MEIYSKRIFLKKIFFIVNAFCVKLPPVAVIGKITPTQAEEFTGVIVIADGKGFTVTEKVATFAHKLPLVWVAVNVYTVETVGLNIQPVVTLPVTPVAGDQT